MCFTTCSATSWPDIITYNYAISRILCNDGIGILSAASSMKLSLPNSIKRVLQCLMWITLMNFILSWMSNRLLRLHHCAYFVRRLPSQRNNDKMVSKNSGRCSIHCEIFNDNPKASKKNKSRHQGRRGIFQTLLGWVFQLYTFEQVPSNNLWQAQTTKKHLRYH